MKAWLRHVAALVLVLFVSMIVTPPKAEAAMPSSEDVAFVCGYDQNGQQRCDVLQMGAIYWGGSEYIILSQGEFLLVVVFIVVSYAVFDAMLNSGNPPEPTCYNCADGFLNRVNGIPTP